MAAPKKKQVKLSITCRVSQKAIDNCEAISKKESISFSKVVTAAMESYMVDYAGQANPILKKEFEANQKFVDNGLKAKPAKSTPFLESRRKSKQGLK